jgi:hypothetical protein
MMRLNILLYFFLFAFFCSCSTTSYHVNIQEDDPVYSAASLLQNNEKNTQGPQFLIDITSNFSGLNLEIEGAWKNDFSILEMNIVGLMGESYGHVTLTENKIELSNEIKKNKNTKEIEGLIEAIRSVGPRNLRRIFAGTYFLPEKSKPIFYRNSKSLQNEIYTDSFIELSDHKITTKSEVILSSPVKKEFTVKTKFQYTFISSRNLMNIFWNGTIEKGKTSPHIIKIESKAGLYQIQFLDYN